MSEVGINFSLLNESGTFIAPRPDSALEWDRAAIIQRIRSLLLPEKIPTDLVAPDVYSIFPISWDFPRTSVGGPILKTAKTLDIMSHRLASMKKRPGQILQLTVSEFPTDT